MRTFEQFIAEADEMGLGARLASGQINREQERILANRRAARAKLPSQQSNAGVNAGNNKSALAIRSASPARSSSRGQSFQKSSPSVSNVSTTSSSAPASPKVSSNSSPKIKTNNKLARLVARRRAEKVANAIADSPETIAKGAYKFGKNLLKKQEVPKTTITKGSELAGPHRFGPETR